MLLMISMTAPTGAVPATDLGYLLHKHPERVQEFSRSFGTATVFYPEAGQERCTAALLLEVDPIALVRSRGKGSPDFSLSQYVNDRPYAASSLLAVALGDVFRTARAGRCNARPELAAAPLPLEVRLPALPCRGGPDLAQRLFDPLGWSVDARPVPLDERFPEWGESRYVALTLRGSVRLADALNHLYVLLPVLDDAKHYWIAPDEVDKLVRAGSGWLRDHPSRGLIARRYLGRRRSLERTALARLAELGDELEEHLHPSIPEDTAPDFESGITTDEAVPETTLPQPNRTAPDLAPPHTTHEPAPDPALPHEAVPNTAHPLTTDTAAPTPALPHEPVTGGLSGRRRVAVLDRLEELGVSSVIDLGCGRGELLGELLGRPRLTRVAGMDVSPMALAAAARKLRLDRMPDARRARLTLFQGALTYADPRMDGYDAAVLMEVIEHVDPPRLDTLERVVFGTAAPRHVLVTTPNAEYNVRYPSLTGMRHPDHRFEWTRAEFTAWATAVAERNGYRVSFEPIGDEDPEAGPPTQMGVFTRDHAS